MVSVSVGSIKKHSGTRSGKYVVGEWTPKSRSLFAKIIPIKSAGEFFGFYNMFGRAGAFLGPLLVAIFVSTFESASYGLIPIAVLFVLGGLLLIKVKT